MTERALWLDGNGVAGLLAEVFETDMTAVPRACGSCGAVNAVGAHRAYLGAGTVLRCPACGDVAMRIAVLADRHVVELRGRWLIELPRR
jgi:predicted RNA-binding Zn-ribbon protein involved in translation (DUF1610 family)